MKDSKQNQDDQEVEAAWKVLEDSHKDNGIRTALPELWLVCRVELADVVLMSCDVRELAY